jgi:S1-C subfamily serine protease
MVSWRHRPEARCSALSVSGMVPMLTLMICGTIMHAKFQVLAFQSLTPRSTTTPRSSIVRGGEGLRLMTLSSQHNNPSTSWSTTRRTPPCLPLVDKKGVPSGARVPELPRIAAIYTSTALRQTSSDDDDELEELFGSKNNIPTNSTKSEEEEDAIEDTDTDADVDPVISAGAPVLGVMDFDTLGSSGSDGEETNKARKRGADAVGSRSRNSSSSASLAFSNLEKNEEEKKKQKQRGGFFSRFTKGNSKSKKAELVTFQSASPSSNQVNNNNTEAFRAAALEVTTVSEPSEAATAKAAAFVQDNENAPPSAPSGTPARRNLKDLMVKSEAFETEASYGAPLVANVTAAGDEGNGIVEIAPVSMARKRNNVPMNNEKKDPPNRSLFSRIFSRSRQVKEDILSAEEVRRARLKVLEADGRQTHNAPSLRRLLERETLRLGEAAELFNISSTAAALMEQAQSRKRSLIRNVEQNQGKSSKKGSSSTAWAIVRAFISPAGLSGKLKYFSFVAFLLLVAPIPRRFSVMDTAPPTANYGDSSWANKYKYDGNSGIGGTAESTPKPDVPFQYKQEAITPKVQQQQPPQQSSPSLDDMPMKYATGTPIPEQSPSAQGIEEQRHYISSFVAKAVRKVGPSVIRIDTERYVDGPVGGTMPRSPQQTPFFGLEDFDSGNEDAPQDRPIEQGQGSGIIFSQDGLVLTNAHVVEGASRVTVTLTDGRRYVAQVKGQDEMVDLAVLQIVSSSTESMTGPSVKQESATTKDTSDSTKNGKKDDAKADVISPPLERRWEGEPLPVAAFGNSETVEVGEWVIAVGNPVGLDNTVTMGIISSIKRSAAEVGIPNKKVEFIQTDAAINPGNSGGPLVNEHGDIIGINTCIRANAEGIGFAIPINKAKSIMYELAEGRNIQHGYIGIVMTTMTPDFARQNNANPNSPAGVVAEKNGALVMRVLEKTPASECGLRRFDVVIEMNGERVANASEAQAVVDAARVGDDMELKIMRGDKELLLTVKPGDLGQKIREAKEKDRQQKQQQQVMPPGMLPQSQGDGNGGRIFIFPMIPGQ